MGHNLYLAYDTRDSVDLGRSQAIIQMITAISSSRPYVWASVGQISSRALGRNHRSSDSLIARPPEQVTSGF